MTNGVTGYKELISSISSTAFGAAAEVHRVGIRKSLEKAIILTQHSSSNAAFNWRVVPLGATPDYFDFHGIPPVGEAYELRSVEGDDSSIKIVAAVSLDRENHNIIDQNWLDPVSISNPLDELGNPKYLSNARLFFVRDNFEGFFNELEFEVFREIKESSFSIYSNVIS